TARRARRAALRRGESLPSAPQLAPRDRRDGRAGFRRAPFRRVRRRRRRAPAPPGMPPLRWCVAQARPDGSRALATARLRARRAQSIAVAPKLRPPAISRPGSKEEGRAATPRRRRAAPRTTRAGFALRAAPAILPQAATRSRRARGSRG